MSIDGGLGNIADIMGLALFLVSPEARWMTGTTSYRWRDCFADQLTGLETEAPTLDARVARTQGIKEEARTWQHRI